MRSVAIGGNAAPLPSNTHEVRIESCGDARTLGHVRRRNRAGEPAAAAPAADRCDTDDRGGLEVVRRGVSPGARKLDQRLDRRRDRHHLGVGRPASPHRDDDHVVVGREQSREVSGHRRLPDTLPRPHDGDRGHREGSPCRRIEPEVRPDVRDAARQHPAGERETLGRAEHGLVGEVDDDVRRVRGDRGLDVGGERDPVLLTSAQLLLPADENGGGEVVWKLHESVTHDGGIVLAVDDRNRPHVRAVTSSSMVPVNFAYSSVSSEKETSRSWPWNG